MIEDLKNIYNCRGFLGIMVMRKVSSKAEIQFFLS